MVTQQVRSKTSSVEKKGQGTYVFHCVIKADWQLPVEPELEPATRNLGGGVGEYRILAGPGVVAADPSRWRTPPHRVFVNLPASATPELGTEIVEEKALLGFSKRYGFLSNQTANNRWISKVESSASLEAISQNISAYTPVEFRELLGAKSQAILKYAWKSGDKRTVEEIAEYTSESLRPHVDVATGAVAIKVADAWTMTCLLFLRDHAAGKTAVCANPECPAPYFLRSRKTQKICEAGECVAWAQRNYSLKWWRENESKAAKAKEQREEGKRGKKWR